MLILVDTNVWISYLLNPKGKGTILSILDILRVGTHTLLIPIDLLVEIRAVVERKPALQKRISLNKLDSFLDFLIEMGEVMPQIKQPIPTITRDPKDDYLIAHGLLDRADFLVTGDKDLLVLEQVGKMKIISPVEIVARLPLPEW